MKKLSVILIVLAILLTLVSCSQADAKDDAHLSSNKTIVSSTTKTTVSNEVYGKNLGNSMEQARIIRKNKKFKKYDVYLDDSGVLTLMVFDDENKDIEYGEEISSELFKHHEELHKIFTDANLDTKIIYKKVKFGKQYLLNIQKFVSKNSKEEYGIVSIGSGGMINKVEIGLLDLEKSKDILALLEENFDGFSKDAVTFIEEDPNEFWE